MSFRSRLTLFFVLIVIVPMVSVAFVLFRLISDNESGKADARIAARQEAAIRLTVEAREAADRIAVQAGRDPGLAVALRNGDTAKAERRARALRERLGAARIVVLDDDGTVLADDGARRAVFPATRQLVGEDGEAVARIQVAVQNAADFARLVRRVTGLEVVVRSGSDVLAATLDGSGGVPVSGGPPREVEVGKEIYRAAAFSASGIAGERVTVAILEAEAATQSEVTERRILAGGILLGFFVLAFTFAVLVSRSLQRQIESFLQAARRLGRGDFSAQVPTTGRDEFAQLGEQFNQMSAQLAARLEELGQERARMEQSLRRLGQSFASNLDRDALLEIVVQTVVDGVGADGGRAIACGVDGGRPGEVAGAGEARQDDGAAAEAEAQALSTGEPVSVRRDGTDAASHPLSAGPAAGAGGGDGVAGAVTIWRRQRPFSAAERELFHYLAGQASVSVSNVGLHEVVERQALTDELTGLSNRRRFDEVLLGEAERARRFEQDVGLVLLDIDDFKRVNDTHGHPQGDEVLRRVAAVVRSTSREIDIPARYGGEEMAVILPGTDLDGTHAAAERIRAGLHALSVELLDAPGALQVTASLGAASLPACAADPESLVAAADAALYEAKRAGKDRTVRAATAQAARPPRR